jgi:hypothetical protein
MNITILNGNPSGDNRRFDEYLEFLAEGFVSEGQAVKLLRLMVIPAPSWVSIQVSATGVCP